MTLATGSPCRPAGRTAAHPHQGPVIRVVGGTYKIGDIRRGELGVRQGVGPVDQGSAEAQWVERRHEFFEPVVARITEQSLVGISVISNRLCW
jgi:hypothetical protein